MKKSKIIVSLCTIFVLFACSASVYIACTNFKEKQTDKIQENDFYEQLSGADIINDSIYVISDNLTKTQDSSPYDRFASTKIALSEQDKDVFNSTFNQWYDMLSNEVNLKYQAINKANGQNVNNVSDDLFAIMQDDSQKKYQWLLQVDFDHEGNVSFHVPMNDTIKKENTERKYLNHFDWFKKNSYNGTFYLDMDHYNRDLYDKSLTSKVEGLSDDGSISVVLNNPKDISIVLAIPTKLVSNHGEIYASTTYYDHYNFSDRLLFVLLFASAVSILYMLFVPMRYLKQMSSFRNLMRLKLEVLLAGGTLLGTGMVVAIVEVLEAEANGYLLSFAKEIGLKDFADMIPFAMIIACCMVLFYLIMLAVYAIKLLFEKGIKRFIKEDCLIGYVYRSAKNIMHRALQFDLDDSTNQSILKVVGINFVVVLLMCLMFGFNIFLSLIYSIVLFVLLRNKMNSVRDDYEVLLTATKKISNGEFDVDIKDDLGMFNSLRDEFSNIKDGFEKAVNEEVKSQRMKTELISNVSHDLKTPLTSIITYVDLLKNPDLSETQRQEYIATLDRNSMRLKNLIDDLFEVSKVNSGNVKLNVMEVDIVSLIKQAYFENLDRLQEKELDFKMNFSDEKIVYTLDSSKTYRIFENLLVNISKYALDHTRVYIDVQNMDSKVVITFKNISANEIFVDENELCERFVQGDTSRNTGGSGLGLAIAKSFTNLQGGTFKVEVDGDLFKAIVTFIK
ncbi:MAG: sensor histidine kinase [Erysipelotrichia bacterium]|nr:sensor histidine kinase [Erysipelotrichia bacterium]NCC53998.1 sensor histidine kinase [Erysipelotrichia bacterium]